MGCFCGLLSCVSCKACCCFWSSQACGNYLCPVNCCISCSKQPWYFSSFCFSIPLCDEIFLIFPISFSEENTSSSWNFSFFSSFQSNLLVEGLGSQVGWGHVWNRFAGPLSCHDQSNQCAHTPFLPPAWWDGLLQSSIPRDIHRLEAFGVDLSSLGTFDQNQLLSFCNSRKSTVLTLPISQMK